MKKEVLVPKKEVENSDRTGKYNSLVIFLVLIITALVFSGSLKLDWTNWDDDLYVYENPLVSEGNLKDIFTKPADYNTYSPMVITSFALEWKLVNARPFLYHLDNLLLHLFCTALVWLLFRSLGLNVWWSGFAALLFGIHPLRVESVAWITERKDLLYALFYMAALLAYIRYIASGKSGQLLLTFLFFTLSLLSKIQAVTLPFALVMLDWYFRRKICFKAIMEKVVFFAVSLIIGLLGSTFFIKNVYVTTDSKAIANSFNFLEQIVLGVYAYAVFILKSVFPFAISTLYPIPALLQAEHWIGAATAVFIFAGALAVWRKYRFITFGLLFFTFNIFILLFLPFWTSDFSFLHDRYTYVAYIGLFFIIAMSMQKLSKSFPSFRLPAACLAVILLFVFSALTIKYIPVWKNSETLWNYVIEKYPRKIAIAYLNRSHYWYKNNQPGKAIEDLSMAIETNPEYLKAYMNRGFIYLKSNDIGNALKDYNRCLELMLPYNTSFDFLNPPLSDVLGNRGLIYSKMGQYEKAMFDFNLAIRLNPANYINYINRASVYHKLGRAAEAKQDLLNAKKMGALIDLH
ncbi:MAG: tetratricopeptide repeat protein [Deltaproteobacteria bacterium]|nr:tetratricopeptide repeat protein [Deltaproteobacteria bacterium]